MAFFLQHRAHVIDDSWCMACLVADVLKHRKDARVDAEVDENVCHHARLLTAEKEALVESG